MSSTSIVFASGLAVGTTSAPQTVVLSNTGSATLAISSISLGGTNPAVFAVTNNCGGSLAVAASCNINLTFTPPSVGTFSATVNISDNAANSPQSITLSGSTSGLTQCKATATRKPLPSTTSNYAGVTFSGKAMVGSQPLIGATVQLYAAGTSGLGSAPTALLTTALTTSATGAFSVTTPYNCPYNLSMLYAVARGGKPGTLGVTNSNIVLMTALGTCNSVANGASFTINEATTVAGVYALSQFLSTGANVGATLTNFGGLQLAANSAANLVNITGGAVPGATFPSTGIAPTARINSLANMLNSCAVTRRFLRRAIHRHNSLRHRPHQHARRHAEPRTPSCHQRCRRSTRLPPRQPPSPRRSPVRPPTGRCSSPTRAAACTVPRAFRIDSAGNVHVANYFNQASFFTNTGTAIVPNGVTGNNLNNSYGIATDVNDNAWIPNEQSTFSINSGLGSVEVLNSTGAPVAELTPPAASTTPLPSRSTPPAWPGWSITATRTSRCFRQQACLFPAPPATQATSSRSPSPSRPTPSATATSPTRAAQHITRSRPTAPASSQLRHRLRLGGPGGRRERQRLGRQLLRRFRRPAQLDRHRRLQRLRRRRNHPPAGHRSRWLRQCLDRQLPRPLHHRAGRRRATFPGTPLSPSAGFGPDAAFLEAFAIAIDAGGNIWVTNFGNNTITEFVGLAAPVRTPMLGPVTLP